MFKQQNKTGLIGFAIAALAVVGLIVAAGHSGVSPDGTQQISKDSTLASQHSDFSGVDLSSYETALDRVNDERADDLLCWLHASSKKDSDEHGSWRKVKMSKSCSILDSETIYIDDAPHGLTRVDIFHAHKWFLKFLIENFFDSKALDSRSGWSTWVNGEAPQLYSSEMQTLLNSKFRTSVEADGILVDSDFPTLNYRAGTFLDVLPHDSDQRLLAISEKGGYISADFNSLKVNQVKFSGYFSAFFRVDNRRLINHELAGESKWTRASLKEAHPEFFDGSPLVIRVDVSLENTLEKTSNRNWRISSWGRPSISWLWVY